MNLHSKIHGAVTQVIDKGHGPLVYKKKSIYELKSFKLSHGDITCLKI